MFYIKESRNEFLLVDVFNSNDYQKSTEMILQGRSKRDLYNNPEFIYILWFFQEPATGNKTANNKSIQPTQITPSNEIQFAARTRTLACPHSRQNQIYIPAVLINQATLRATINYYIAPLRERLRALIQKSI